MCAKLLILESHGKVKKVQSFLGPDWKVVASVGHVRDLPVKEMGVAAPDFKPHYQPTERGADVLKRLGALAKQADVVYLATDPDREGEAIAWHVADALKLKDAKRVTYGEITESAVKAAVQSPRAIDMALVAAQEGRRVLDRFCGYLVSGPLSRAVGTRLSAGRVQSPALRLVVERERAITSFVSVTHYGAELSFEGWKAAWVVKSWIEPGQEYFQDQALAEKMAGLRSLEILDCEESEARVAPPTPFTTSSLQQAASNALKFKPKQTMSLAQALYEQGHITYMRTDSPNLSQEAVAVIRAYADGQGWPLPDKPRTWKAKDGAQEAHEAIRPTHIEEEDAGETADEKALYRLIRVRALASQLADSVYAVRLLRLSADVDGKQATFEAKGRTLQEQGWKVLLAADEATKDDAEDEPDNPVPALQSGAQVTALSGRVLTKKTKPPTRYTLASLVRELENRGIGRPSTFAAILDTIQTREYIKEEKRYLVPTPLGVQVVDALVNAFSFVDYAFTKEMEQALDDIASGKTKYQQVVATAFNRLMDEVTRFDSAHAVLCPECQSPKLRHIVKEDTKNVRGYDFFACPDCEATFPNVDGKPGPKQDRKKPELSEYKCGECGKPLIRRMGTTQNGKPYDFFGCSGFPKCKAKYEVKDSKPV